MKLIEILNEEKQLLLESGIRIPGNIKSFKIIHHDDADGIEAAQKIQQVIIKQMLKRWRGQFKSKKENDKIKEIKDRITYRTISDSDEGKTHSVLKRLDKSPNQFLIVVDFDRFKKLGDEVVDKLKRVGVDFHSDHHTQADSSINVGKTGRTGATQYPSDTEHIAVKQGGNFNMDWGMIKQVSKWDSASFDEKIEKELGIEKGNPKFNPARELVAIVSQIARSKQHQGAIEKFIKDSGETIPSKLRYARNLKYYVNLQSEGNTLINKKPDKFTDEDKKRVDQIRKELHDNGFTGKHWEVGKGLSTKPISDFNDLQKKNIKDSKNSPKESGVNKGKKTFSYESDEDRIVVSELSGGGQPGRYTAFTFKNSKGEKPAFGIRKWPNMLQVSVAPDVPKEAKEKIDLDSLTGEILNRAKDKFGNKYNSWAFDKVIKGGSGYGHASISTIQNFHLLGLLPKKMRQEMKEISNDGKYKKYESLDKTAKEKKDFLEKTPDLKQKVERYKEIEKIKKGDHIGKKRKKEIMDYVVSEFKKELNKLAKEIKIEESKQYKNRLKELCYL